MRLEIQTRRSHKQTQPQRGMAWRKMPLGEILTHQVKILSAVQYSGSIGNLTYSHNMGGQYIRARATPTNPNSTRQSQVRTFLGNFASNWTLVLTQVQRDAWRTYAENNTHTDAFGNQISLPPHNWYIMLNARLLDAGQAVIADPPPVAGPTGFTTFVVGFAAIDQAVVTFTPALPAGTSIQLWQSLPVSVGSAPNFNQARLVGYSAIIEASPWTATLPHPIPVGQRGVFFGAIMDGYGQISARMAYTIDST